MSGKGTGIVKTGPLQRLNTISSISIILGLAVMLAWIGARTIGAPQAGRTTGRPVAAAGPGVSDAGHAYAGPLIILSEGRVGQAPIMSRTERDLLTGFAAEKNLRPVWKTYHNTDELFRYLNNHNQDIVITSLDNSNIEFDDPVKYTLPWGIYSQQVVVRSDSQRISSIDDLSTRQVAVKKSSPAWQKLQALASKNPGMDLQIIPEQMSADQVMARVTSGYYDLAVMDNFSVEQNLPNYLDLKVALTIGQERVMSWAVRSPSGNLQQAMNHFLYKNHLKMSLSKVYRGDLPALEKRKVLRLITYQSPVNYYLDNGKLQGFEYDLMKRFAKNNGMRLGVVIANSFKQMEEMLVKGQGDVIAASLPRGSFPATDRIAYTRAYGFSTPVVIGRSLDYPLLDVRDLAGRRIVLPAESPYRAMLERIRNTGVNFDLITAPAGVNTAATLYQVSRGDYDLTVIGSNQINAEFEGRLNLKSHFALSEPLPETWVVRAGANKLLHALNAYINKEYRKGFYNLLLAKYINNPAPSNGRNMLSEISQLSPYDDIVHKYAEQFGFDWRLIVAQMYQESHFDPTAVSNAGAEGLMQLTPDTGELVGIKNLDDPNASIYGGIKYLAYLRGRFEDDLPMEARTWFTLAAYNAGYNRVKRARWLAEKMGLNKNKWFNNVERAMQVLARPHHKNGELIQYCHCGQTTTYIRNIRTLYNNYVRLTQTVRLASDTPVPGKDS